ncbi:unnamed protein product, partial [Ixodes pacificus]
MPCLLPICVHSPDAASVTCCCLGFVFFFSGISSRDCLISRALKTRCRNEINVDQSQVSTPDVMFVCFRRSGGSHFRRHVSSPCRGSDAVHAKSRARTTGSPGPRMLGQR